MASHNTSSRKTSKKASERASRLNPVLNPVRTDPKAAKAAWTTLFTKATTWKTIAILFIILFISIVFGGFLKAYQLRQSVTPATDAQLSLARAVVLRDLAARAENVSLFTWRISNRIRSMPAGAQGFGTGKERNESIMEVSLFNSSVRYGYILNIVSGDILIYSKTEFYGGIIAPPDDMHPVDARPAPHGEDYWRILRP